MDPDCAICRAPANRACDCEAKGLETAVRQAETRMMQQQYTTIRTWVREHAQDFILEHFRQLTERRKATHNGHLERLTAHAYHYYNAPPHPNEIAQAQSNLKRGIDDDWRSSVQRYPEVLEYFYSLVEVTLPDDDDSAVKDPPLPAPSVSRKASRRQTASLNPDSQYERERQRGNLLPRRTPPPHPMDRGLPDHRVEHRAPPQMMEHHPLVAPPHHSSRRSGHHRTSTAPPPSFYGYP